MVMENIADLSARLRMPAISLEQFLEQQAAFDLIPYSEAARRTCVALRDAEGAVSVVLGDPFDLDTQDWIEERLAAPFRYRLASREDVSAYLAQQETGLRAMDGVSKNLLDNTYTGGAQEISFEAAAEADSPVVKLVSSTLYDALKAGASDVHLESTASGLSIKYRVDGVLTAAESMPGTELAEQVISRIKVMSELDIAERRVPQDGRFKARRDGRDIDFRVSVMPSVYGEDAVLRILDRRALTDQLQGLTLDALGFSAEMKQNLRQLSTEPYGMVLVTGPTGSGKTTTLYAVISEANKGLDKIITIEDPVEYQLPGVLQIPVNEQKGLSFARGLAFHPAPRPGPHHGRRDPRPGDRRDRGAVGPDRPPGLHHGARQQRDRRARPLPAHGRGRLQPGLGAERRAGAAAGAGLFAKACRSRGCAECRNTGLQGQEGDRRAAGPE